MTITRQRLGDDEVGVRHFPAHEREDLVRQLQKAALHVCLHMFRFYVIPILFYCTSPVLLNKKNMILLLPNDILYINTALLQGLDNGCSLPATPQSISDLKSLATALLETIHEENIIIQHQRQTNRFMCNCFCTRKLKTLEISGLWSLPDDRTGRGGPSPWEQDTAGDDMWPAPEEEDTPVTPDIGEESVSCGTDTGRMTDGQVRAEVKEGPGSPAVEEGQVLAEDPAQIASVTLEQTVRESADFHASALCRVRLGQLKNG
uniref:Coiled-coil domain containing 149a n=1 Tax=Cyprinus carpio TaxID=7962 RepID=A0A8C2GUE1_CYPCA